MKKILVMAVLFSACAPKSYKIQQTVENKGNTQTVVNKTSFGKNDLQVLKEEWQTETIMETGEAFVSEKYPEKERNKQLARRGAILDAQRKLAEKISLIRLNATTTMKDFETTDFVQSRVNTYLKEVEVFSENYDEKNNKYQVTIKMDKTKLVQVLEEYFH